MIEKIEQIEELLKNSINGEVFDQEVIRLTEPGENYTSIVLKVDVKIRNRKNGEEETLATVAKVLPPDQDNFIAMGTVAFKNEIAWYKHIMPAMKQFQKDRGVDKVADFFATMYGARLNLDPEKDTADATSVILFENLKVQGYANADRFVGFDKDTTDAVLRVLATFHAVLIAMKLHDPQLFEKELRSRLRGFEPENDPTLLLHDEIKLNMEKLIKEDPECALLWSRIEPYTENFFPYSDIIREPWTTIAHSDCWVNNIMVSPQEGASPRVKLLDFQMTPYKSALSDFIFFLFTSVENHVLKTHFEHFLKYYYNQFLENLKQLNADTSLFGYEAYLTEIGTVIKESELAHALCFMFFILAPKGTAPDAMEVGFETDQMSGIFTRETCETHKEKAWFVVQECYRRNWI